MLGYKDKADSAICDLLNLKIVMCPGIDIFFESVLPNVWLYFICS